MIDENVFVIDEERDKARLELNTSMNYLLHLWMENIEQGKALKNFFLERDYKKIAIYGMGILGKHFYTQIKNSGLEVCYYIDRDIIYFKDMEYHLAGKNEDVIVPDVIVITPIMEYEDIKEKIIKYINTNIVSIEEVIRSL